MHFNVLFTVVIAHALNVRSELALDFANTQTLKMQGSAELLETYIFFFSLRLRYHSIKPLHQTHSFSACLLSLSLLVLF